MNLRHAAALALVGWYLMVPPPQSFENHKLGPPDLMAPLSSWRQEDQFDRVKDCEGSMLKTKVYFANLKTNGDAGIVNNVKAWMGARCIASDDPRLKGK